MPNKCVRLYEFLNFRKNIMSKTMRELVSMKWSFLGFANIVLIAIFFVERSFCECPQSHPASGGGIPEFVY